MKMKRTVRTHDMELLTFLGGERISVAGCPEFLFFVSINSLASSLSLPSSLDSCLSSSLPSLLFLLFSFPFLPSLLLSLHLTLLLSPIASLELSSVHEAGAEEESLAGNSLSHSHNHYGLSFNMIKKMTLLEEEDDQVRKVSDRETNASFFPPHFYLFLFL